jgi:hypothetical protein
MHCSGSVSIGFDGSEHGFLLKVEAGAKIGHHAIFVGDVGRRIISRRVKI